LKTAAGRTPAYKDFARKVKLFNIRYRRRQRRKTQNPSSAQHATATIESDSIEEVIIFSTRSLHAMALRNRKKYCWNGACIDIGAQRTVIGLSQARGYCKFLGIPFALSISKRVSVFGVDKWNSLGIFHIRLPTPNGSFIMLEVNVAPTIVPMLLGLDVLDKFGLCADTVHNVIHCTAEDWNLPLVRKLGQVYLEWSATDRILCKKSELQKLHCNFSHPLTQNLFTLLKRAKADNVDANTRAVLSDIENACSICQCYSSKPLRLITTLPSGEESSFGSELSMDLMFINGIAVLHVIDSAPRFNAATFLDSNSEYTGKARTAYGMRLSTYGAPSGSAFTSVKWKTLTKSR
jgi:hypothetical protein